MSRERCLNCLRRSSWKCLISLSCRSHQSPEARSEPLRAQTSDPAALAVLQSLRNHRLSARRRRQLQSSERPQNRIEKPESDRPSGGVRISDLRQRSPSSYVPIQDSKFARLIIVCNSVQSSRMVSQQWSHSTAACRGCHDHRWP